MTSGALSKCKHIPAWVKTFLSATKDGFSMKTSANMAGASTQIVNNRLEKDPEFKANYEHAVATKRQRPSHGVW